MAVYPAIPAICPSCGSTTRTTETALDPSGFPTDLLAVSCAACGRFLGNAPPLEASSETDASEQALLVEEVGEQLQSKAGEE